MKNLAKYLLIIPVLFYSLSSCCDCKKNQEGDEQVIPIVGKISWDDWQKNAGWKDYEAKNYKIEENKITKLKTKFEKNKDLEFVMFSGNWCSDSRDEVPKFFKLINQTELNLEKITLYGVDRNKQEPTGEAQKNKIEKVPTLLILKDGMEIGRIVEFPFISWEDDLLTILEEY